MVAGEVARAGERYIVTLMLMDTSTLVPAWRLHKEVTASPADLRGVIQQAAEQLRAASL